MENRKAFIEQDESERAGVHVKRKIVIPTCIVTMVCILGLNYITTSITHINVSKEAANIVVNGRFAEESYCFMEGSLHQLAVDMVRHSSPPGSPSYEKFRRVLDSHSVFYVSMGGKRGIFARNEEMMARMLDGYGLRQALDRPSNSSSVILVETQFTTRAGPCPLADARCSNQSRIFVQSEQIFRGGHVEHCHRSPNCIILDFSERNLQKASAHGSIPDLVESFVLLPVMTQTPSRMSSFEPRVPKGLRDRGIDMAFFGEITNRRTGLINDAREYERSHPGRAVRVQKSHSLKFVGSTYPEAKVCLMAHSYKTNAGGEYHRMSEFGPFGCVPVLERFGDGFGLDRYERCSGAVFVNYTDIVPTAAQVVKRIDAGEYDGVGEKIVDWWRTGIRWEQLLRTISREGR